MPRVPDGAFDLEPGSWRLVTPRQIRAFRAAHGLSVARLGEILGLGAGDVQSWEDGAVASMKTQQQLAELFASGPSLATSFSKFVSVRRPAAPRAEAAAPIDAQVLCATGQIVTAYLAAHGTIAPEELIKLVRSVRGALSSDYGSNRRGRGS